MSMRINKKCYNNKKKEFRQILHNMLYHLQNVECIYYGQSIDLSDQLSFRRSSRAFRRDALGVACSKNGIRPRTSRGVFEVCLPFGKNVNEVCV